MITVSTISFAEIAKKKALSRALDQQLVDQGQAEAVQRKNSLFNNKTGSLSIEAKSVFFRPRLCLTPHHPLLCIESKAHNLAYLPQEERQDEKHLRLSIGNLHSYLLKFDDSFSCQQIVNRVSELSLTSHGVAIFHDYNINFLDAVPWSDWLHSENSELKIIGEQQSLHLKNLNALI